MSDKIKAWYFSGETRKLRNGDGRKIKLGETHTIERVPVLCKRGLHGSVNILDALKYAPGPIVWRVELSGDMDKGHNKISAQSRTYLSGGIDISELLRKFARMCALDVIHLWDAPDVVVKYLKTGDDTLRVAVRSAAWAAAESAEGTSAWAAAWAAEESAEESAAWASAWYAAWAAAWAAEESATLAKQGKRLITMVNAEIKKRSQ